MAERLQLFATASRGTEGLLAEELAELGARGIRQDPGGVRFRANWVETLRICLWTRIAMRILYHLGDYAVEGADGLYEAVSSVLWEEHLTASSTFSVEATLKESEHRHSGFVALKVKDAIVDRLRHRLGARPDVKPRNPDVRVVAHLARRRLSLSLDVSGDPLYQRGYRIEPTPATLKETLAAAILRASGYRGTESLVDPMCGSGTLLIEGAFIAANRAPGLSRGFGVERWPRMGQKAAEILGDLRSHARAAQCKPVCPILGFDKDDEAVAASKKNARAGQVFQLMQLLRGDATRPLPLANVPGGLMVTNPPYGERLQAGGKRGMKAFYFQLGENLRRLAGWRLAILVGNPAFESAFHLRPIGARALWNGPIECQLLSYQVRPPVGSA